MADVTLNRILRVRALQHAVYAEESTADIVWGALEEFLKKPRLSIPIGWQTPDHQELRVFVGKPYLEGIRDTVAIDDQTYRKARACATSLGISIESLVDLAVENECASVSDSIPSWKDSGSP